MQSQPARVGATQARWPTRALYDWPLSDCPGCPARHSETPPQKGPRLGRGQDQVLDRRRQDDGAIHAPELFRLRAQVKLFITGNHKARLDNVDEAMRRRLLLVPFTVQIPPEERDLELFRSSKPSGRQSCAG